MESRSPEYRKAKRIQRTGFLNQIAGKLVGDEKQSLGDALKESISEKAKATLTGYKESLDALSIVNRITGDSALAVVLVGRLLGRSEEDIEYFSGISSGKKKKKNPLKVDKAYSQVRPIRKNEPFADALGKLYPLYQKIIEDEKLEQELKTDFNKQEEELKEHRHKEILDVLRGVVKEEKGAGKERINKIFKNAMDKKDSNVVLDAFKTVFDLAKTGIEAWVLGDVGAAAAAVGTAAVVVGGTVAVSTIAGDTPTDSSTPNNKNMAGKNRETIIGDEVRKGGTISWRNNNPGNIRPSAFATKHGAIGQSGGFAVFPTLEAGEKARKDLLFQTTSYKYLTITQAISKYAPPNENPTASYIANVSRSVGVSPDTKLSDLNITQQDKMLASMKQIEGFKVGKVEKLQTLPDENAKLVQVPEKLQSGGVPEIASNTPAATSVPSIPPKAESPKDSAAAAVPVSTPKTTAPKAEPTKSAEAIPVLTPKIETTKTAAVTSTTPKIAQVTASLMPSSVASVPKTEAVSTGVSPTTAASTPAGPQIGKVINMISSDISLEKRENIQRGAHMLFVSVNNTYNQSNINKSPFINPVQDPLQLSVNRVSLNG
jgi:hypothetical protein